MSTPNPESWSVWQGVLLVYDHYGHNLGLDVRVGMEDTIFKWPRKNDLIANNVSVFASTATIANNLGRGSQPPMSMS